MAGDERRHKKYGKASEHGPRSIDAIDLIRFASMQSRILRPVACVSLFVALLIVAVRGAGALSIYFIDVEGGQSTLIVTPSGQSLLVDAGFGDPPGRDPRRVLTAAQDAGVSRIDYLLLTHFHADHIGGVPELEKRIEIGAIIDHDGIAGSDPQVVKPFNLFVPARKKVKQHIVAKVGDRLPLKDVEAIVVSSAGATLKQPLAGAGDRNVACRLAPQSAHDVVENPRSTGFRLVFGQFRFLDLGDLSGKPLFALVCPVDLIGSTDVYLVPHHGNDDVTDPATFAAFKPRVAILNNGDTKGGAPEMLAALRKVAGLEDVWQLHRSENRGAVNFADEQIANLDTRSAHWIKVSALEDGSFTVTNGRTGATKSYASASARRATR
jgi:competence protein ComEC